MDLSFLTQFIDANKIGGWVRAGVASLLGVIISKWPLLANYLDPTTQAALGVAASGIVIGIWSQLTKTDAAKIAAVTAMPDVKQIVVSKLAVNGVATAAADPNQPKVVKQS